MLEEFKNYVSNYDMSDNNIERKYYHSLRVKSLCQVIAKYAGFNDEDIKIAEVVGLLHDYGRFPQWEKYKTYRDNLSIDHADYAVEKLFDEGQIANYWTNTDDYDEIYDAIKYHNKLNIPDDLSKHNKLLCQVIRDADKLDILYLYASNTCKFVSLDDEISEKVKNDFNNEKLIDYKDIKYPVDHFIQTLALVYDLNFKYSFEHLKKYKIFDQIYDNVKDKEKFKPYFDKVNNYIDRKIKE